MSMIPNKTSLNEKTQQRECVEGQNRSVNSNAPNLNGKSIINGTSILGGGIQVGSGDGRLESGTVGSQDEVRELDYWKDLDLKRFFLVGSSVYMAECVAIYPLDVIKTRMQVNMGREEGYVRSTIKTTKHVYKTLGMRGFFKGYWTQTLGSLPSNASYILTYNYSKHIFQKFHDDTFNNGKRSASTAIWVPVASAMAAELLSVLLLVPSEVIAHRLQIGDSQYQGGIHAFKTILKHEGIKGLFRGSGAALLTHLPASAVWWLVYEKAKFFLTMNDPRQYLYNITKSKEEIQEQIENSNNYFAQITAGGLAGMTASMLATPLDVVKTRMQIQRRDSKAAIPGAVTGYYTGFFSGMRTIIKEEGFKALTKGILPKITSHTIMSCATSVIYEFVMKHSRKVPESNTPPVKQ